MSSQLCTTSSRTFTILCYYLHLKLSQINRRLVNKEKNIYRIITELTSIYHEISQYNRDYWSKFLLVIYIAMSSLISMITFISFVVGIESKLINGMYFSFAVFNSLFLLLTIGFSSLIYNDCIHTYLLLNSYVLSVKRITMLSKLKVTNIIIPKFYYVFN